MEDLAIILFTIFLIASVVSAIALVIGFIKKNNKISRNKKMLGSCVLGLVVSFIFYGFVQTPETKARLEAERIEKQEQKENEKSEKEALKLKEEEEKKLAEEQKNQEEVEKEKKKKEKEELAKKEKEKLSEKENSKKEEANKKEDIKRVESNKNETSETKKELKLKHGEFLSANINEDMLVIKAKIEPSYSNKATINQNGFNIEDIIKKQGGDKYNEIQYWAVADMSDGSESKVISFTLDKELIDKVKNGNILGNQIIDSAIDVWILRSLQN